MSANPLLNKACTGQIDPYSRTHATRAPACTSSSPPLIGGTTTRTGAQAGSNQRKIKNQTARRGAGGIPPQGPGRLANAERPGFEFIASFKGTQRWLGTAPTKHHQPRGPAAVCSSATPGSDGRRKHMHPRLDHLRGLRYAILGAAVHNTR